jgi:hypothetical protein
MRTDMLSTAVGLPLMACLPTDYDNAEKARPSLRFACSRSGTRTLGIVPTKEYPPDCLVAPSPGEIGVMSNEPCALTG